jgi:hypothetical protein
MINKSFWETAGQKLYQYTKGKEYSLNGYEYIGYYHLADGVPFSEFMPSASSRKLYPYKGGMAGMIYDRIKPDYLKLDTFIEPYQAPLNITAQQYQAGKIIRYFLKKRNENIIYEINKEMVGKVGKEGGFDDMLYQLVKLDWMISTNGATNELLNFNARSLHSANLEMPGLKDKIVNLYEYSIVDITP